MTQTIPSLMAVSFTNWELESTNDKAKQSQSQSQSQSKQGARAGVTGRSVQRNDGDKKENQQIHKRKPFIYNSDREQPS